MSRGRAGVKVCILHFFSAGFLRAIFVSNYEGLQPRCLSSLRYLHGRVFVLELTPGSQAYKDKFICPGDIIDEINGTSLRNSKNGQVGNFSQS